MNGGRTHQDVAHVGTRKNGGNGELFRADRLDVLHRMDRKVDLARDEPGIEFLGPQRLAADFGKRAILDAISAGGDGDEFDRAVGPTMGSA